MSELVTGSLDSVVFWEEKTLTRRRSAQPFPDSNYHVSSLSWSSSNSKLAVVPKWGDRVAVCEFHDHILTWSYLMHQDGGSFTCGCLLSNSRYLVSGCGNSSLLIWDLKHKNIVKTFKSHSAAVTSVVTTPNDYLVVSGGQDGQIFIHPLSSSSKMKTVQLVSDQTSPQPISRLRVSLTEQSHLGSVSESGEVALWSIDSQRRLVSFSPRHEGGATDLSFTPSNKILMVSVGLDACIRCYDLQTRKVVATITAPATLSSVTILRDGSTLLAGGTDGRLYVYELRSLKTPKSVIEAHQTAVTCIAAQSPFKTPAKRGAVRGQGSQHKGQLSPDTSLLHSADKSPPRVQRFTPQVTGSSNKPHPPAPTHKDIASKAHVTTGPMLPETVTPYVTQRPPGLSTGALEVQTPYSVTKPPGLKTEDWGKTALSSVLATPAHSQGNVSSIFSPLDHQQLATPISSAGKITAAVPPTMRAGGLVTTTPAIRGGGLEITTPSGLTVSTPAPLQAATTVPAQPPSAVTPLTGSNRTVHLGSTNSGAGIFSPLDTGALRHGDFQLGQSPLLESTTPSSSCEGHVTSVSHIQTDAPLSQASHVTNALPISQRSHDPIATSSSTDSPSIQPVPVDTTQQAVGDSDKDTSLRNTSVASDDEGKSLSAPPPLASGGAIQTQYLERVIKDSMEELWYSVHRDSRGLTVDLIKQFLTLQEGLAHQFAALNEKVDRLSEENRRLQELVHRYMPKH